MANRHFRQFSFGLEPMPVKLWALVTLTGGNGAQTVTRGKGIKSVVQSGTGLQTITLSDPYVTLLGCDIQSLPVSYAAATSATSFILTGGTITTSGGGTITVQMVNAAGTAVAAAAGDKLLIEISLNNSSAL